MAKQQLDLLQLAASSAAELCARSPQIMRGDARDAGGDSVVPEHLPDDLLAQTVTRNGSNAIYGPEHVATVHTCRPGPCVDRDLHPRRHRGGADSAMLPHEV